MIMREFKTKRSRHRDSRQMISYSILFALKDVRDFVCLRDSQKHIIHIRKGGEK